MSNPHVLIVEARFYDDLADELVAGAVECLESVGATYDRVPVPGALEIPGAIALGAVSRTHSYDGFIALGCVIRGETSHYDYVCENSARALMDMSTQDLLAIGNGILTVEDRDQAWARASRKQKNKWRDAALAALAMIDLAQKFGISEDADV